MTYTCPVCAYDGLEEPPAYFTICPSCGTEFGYQDFIRGHDELRAEWIAKGPQWHSSVITAPPKWDGMEQLRRGGLINYSNEGGDTQTELGIIEIGQSETIINIPAGTARFNTVQYGIGPMVNLFRLRFSGASV